MLAALLYGKVRLVSVVNTNILDLFSNTLLGCKVSTINSSFFLSEFQLKFRSFKRVHTAQALIQISDGVSRRLFTMACKWLGDTSITPLSVMGGCYNCTLIEIGTVVAWRILNFLKYSGRKQGSIKVGLFYVYTIVYYVAHCTVPHCIFLTKRSCLFTFYYLFKCSLHMCSTL